MLVEFVLPGLKDSELGVVLGDGRRESAIAGGTLDDLLDYSGSYSGHDVLLSGED
jgi:hypothetical protein